MTHRIVTQMTGDRVRSWAVRDMDPEQSRRLAVKQKAVKEIRREKRSRRKGLDKGEIELVNAFNELGIDFVNLPRKEAFKKIPEICEGRRWAKFSVSSLAFLQDNYDVEQVVDPDGRKLLHFKSGGKMSIFNDLAEASEQPRKVVKSVYEALVSTIQEGLKENRLIRLPQIGRIKISFRKAKPKRRGRNPFNGKEMWFKAKDASNKLRFRPSKELKEYADELPVIDPKKLKKKKKK